MSAKIAQDATEVTMTAPNGAIHYVSVEFEGDAGFTLCHFVEGQYEVVFSEGWLGNTRTAHRELVARVRKLENRGWKVTGQYVPTAK